MDNIEKMIIDNMGNMRREKIETVKRDKLLFTLHKLQAMTTGQSDQLFCNYFLSEMVKLLTNSISLYEKGYFDCAFYSIRQSEEIANSMVFLSNQDKNDLRKWNNKERFKMNRELIKSLSKINEFYCEVKTAIPDFFDAQKNLIEKANKIIHKQGFDTFYILRDNNFSKYEAEINDEKELFIKLLEHTIGLVIILYIIVDPISLVLTDEELSMRFNFNPMTEAAEVGFFAEYLSEDIISEIKDTKYFHEVSNFFEGKEKMLPSVYDVVRWQAYDIDKLNEIKSQSHLIGLYENIILELLLKGLKFTKIHPDCYMIVEYFTSIESNYHGCCSSSSERDEYLQSDPFFNRPYHNIFRSLFNGIEDNWIFEHNDLLKDEEIEIVKNTFKNFKLSYQKLLDSANAMCENSN